MLVQYLEQLFNALSISDIWMSSDAEALVICFLSLTNHKTDGFSGGRELTASVIHDGCHDNLSLSSIPFCLLAKAGRGRRADMASTHRKTSERGDVENCPIIRG